MPVQSIIVFILTFIIYIISTLAYSVRIVGVRTGRISISFAVFNVFALISRTANSIQTPLMGKTVDISIKSGNVEGFLSTIRWVLLSATLGTIVGALLLPTFIKLFGKIVESFSIHRSIPKLLIHGFSKSGVEQFKKSITPPKKENFSHLKSIRKVPKKIILINTIAFSISVVAGLASLYAGSLNPDLRTTCTTLSSVVSGVSTVLLFLFVDPYVSMMTDDVIRGEMNEIDFDRCIIFIVGGLIAGTIIAQLLLAPAAWIIGFIARII